MRGGVFSGKIPKAAGVRGGREQRRDEEQILFTVTVIELI